LTSSNTSSRIAISAQWQSTRFTFVRSFVRAAAADNNNNKQTKSAVQGTASVQYPPPELEHYDLDYGLYLKKIGSYAAKLRAKTISPFLHP